MTAPGDSGDWWDTGIFTNPDAQPTGGGSQPFGGGGGGGGQPVGGGGSQPKRSGPDWGPFQPGKFMRGDAQDSGAQPSWGNGDGGDDEFATHDELDEATSGIHAKLDDMQATFSGVQSRMEAFGQGSGSQAAPRATGTQRPPGVLQQVAAHSAEVQGRMADSHAALQAGKDRSSAQFQARQSASANGGVTQTGTGNGMSERQSNASMAGILPGTPMRPNSGIGQSQSSFSNTRFKQQ